ncbi:class F sortase [Nocardioides sp.]|uniref:class F sortase n=1 Tax=Nocardioides sp. TaxID=35761 RepID=UPI00271C5687|nr:class F sortase [Nocardioides sp.]MDO9457835.1 class F sortase [Nocardioides sp.]
MSDPVPRHRTSPRVRRRLLLGVAGLVVAVVLSGAAVLTATAAPDSTTIATDRAPGAVAAAATPDEPAAPSTPRPAPSPVRVADAAPVTASAPNRLLVPSIGVDVDVMDLGLTGTGTLEVPPGAFPAGWYVGSPTPGELGPAVLAGHVSWNGTPGVFERLAELEAGDRVSVVREDGRVADFTVTRTAQYPKDRFPTDAVYGDIDRAGLRLITCGGLDAATSTYEDNVVVYARLTGTRRR